MTDNGDQFDEMCAKRKSDRDKPVDAQWLEGQGWRYRPSVVSFGCVYIYDLSGERYLSVGISKGRVHSHLAIWSCTDEEVVICDHVPTRRQLLRLRDALEDMTVSTDRRFRP